MKNTQYNIATDIFWCQYSKETHLCYSGLFSSGSNDQFWLALKNLALFLVIQYLKHPEPASILGLALLINYSKKKKKKFIITHMTEEAADQLIN